MGDIIPPPPPPFRVAIIGGGITGINLAIGLRARGVPFTLYERAPGFREIGAGIGFSPNAEVAMRLLSPQILSAYKRVANPNGEDYFQWADGHAATTPEEAMFRLYVGNGGFQGCRRSDILEEWAKQLPEEEGSVQFGKEVDTVVDAGEGVDLKFVDGSVERATVAIACDGIRSRVRQLLFPEAPAAYTGKYCFRALVPMEKAVETIGAKRGRTRWMYLGPGGHVVTYPVAASSFLNVLIVLSDNKPWPDSTKHTAPGSRSEVDVAFRDWGKTVRGIGGLMPEKMDKWAIFDMKDFPAPQYNKGAICLAGDAAHATGPHLGAGGGLGVEDALVLAELLDELHKGWDRGAGYGRVNRALQAYSDVRYDRTRKVVRDTRQACLLFHWQVEEVGGDGEKFGEAITPKFCHIWQGDVPGMVGDALGRLGREDKE
ncbi:hypothetical protein B0T18DRAFT_320929 [Schizothecium vesticola]|uniref:FAD-binding domain-containing protein n=1 Tax=Schizothecium vesticola TaxID=314040 RepID=A0AA40K8V6_9PEZI|nr:hypothetical protein B0T18DRAFT_320929 [Schizothecium vesticola]